jgi:2-hydroxychromene-2-carboxylate isomerase
MTEQKNFPFVGKPVKMAYMWRDIERRARMYGFEPQLPAPYPYSKFDLPNKIAIVAMSEGWCADYTRAVYRGWFHAGHEPGSEPSVSNSLREVGQDKARVLALAKSDENEKSYRKATEEAKALGVFGSPSFVVGSEVFWSDDRLAYAIRWSKMNTKTETILSGTE